MAGRTQELVFPYALQSRAVRRPGLRTVEPGVASWAGVAVNSSAVWLQCWPQGCMLLRWQQSAARPNCQSTSIINLAAFRQKMRTDCEATWRGRDMPWCAGCWTSSSATGRCLCYGTSWSVLVDSAERTQAPGLTVGPLL